jgi:hypothetical protein
LSVVAAPPDGPGVLCEGSGRGGVRVFCVVMLHDVVTLQPSSASAGRRDRGHNWVELCAAIPQCGLVPVAAGHGSPASVLIILSNRSPACDTVSRIARSSSSLTTATEPRPPGSFALP